MMLLFGGLAIMFILLIISTIVFLVGNDEVAPVRVAIPWFADRPIIM